MPWGRNTAARGDDVFSKEVVDNPGQSYIFALHINDQSMTLNYDQKSKGSKVFCTFVLPERKDRQRQKRCSHLSIILS